ncbi:hypothetical protein HYT05_03325 [Candidatus Kaiserbacteria bacterium]|nr:hypothetical protein [Candidatus Kaiserbacteria bacterium]
MMAAIHLSILALTAIVILIADEQGFAWMRGKIALLDPRRMRWLHRLMWTGLAGMIVTGLIQFLPAYEYYLAEPAFLMKMCFVMILVLNGILIGRLQHIATERPFASLSTAEKMPLLASGAISTIAWVSAGLTGYFLI